MSSVVRPADVDDAAGGVDVSQLHAEHWLRLVRTAALLLEDRAAGEDVVQDAFVTLHRRVATLRDAGAAAAYLQAAVVNGCRSVIRRRQVARRHAPRLHAADPAGADEPVLVAEEHRAVLVALRELPARRRETLVLRYWSGLDDAQIAAAMGVSEGTVRSAVSRGIAELKTVLEGAR